MAAVLKCSVMSCACGRWVNGRQVTISYDWIPFDLFPVPGLRCSACTHAVAISSNIDVHLERTYRARGFKIVFWALSARMSFLLSD